MQYKSLGLAAVLALAGTAAFAQVNIHVNLGPPGRVQAVPVPVYAPPAPPVHVVHAPVYLPRPVAVAPPPMHAPHWHAGNAKAWHKWNKRQAKAQRKAQRQAYRRWHGDRDDD